MGKIAKRVREPSTWAALSVLLTMFGLSPQVVQLAGLLLDAAPILGSVMGPSVAALVPAGVASLAGVLMPESGGE